MQEGKQNVANIISLVKMAEYLSRILKYIKNSRVISQGNDLSKTSLIMNNDIFAVK